MKKTHKQLSGRSVRLDEGTSFEKAMRKFKKKIQADGLLNDLRDREFYTKPTTERKHKKSAAKRRWKKYLESQELPPKKY